MELPFGNFKVTEGPQPVKKANPYVKRVGRARLCKVCGKKKGHRTRQRCWPATTCILLPKLDTLS